MIYWQLERSIYLRVFLGFGDSIRSFLPRFNDMAFPIIDIYEIQRSTFDSPHKGPVICSFDVVFVVSLANCWINSPVSGDMLRRDVASL